MCGTACPRYIETVAQSVHDMHEQKYSGIYPTNYQNRDLRYIPRSHSTTSVV